MKRLVLVLLALALVVFGQTTAPPVNQIDGPPPVALQKAYGYSGSYLTYICWALSRQQATYQNSDGSVTLGSPKIAISAATNASAVEFTSAAHNLYTYATPSVTVSGGTGTWGAVNGTWTATVTGANTFTIPVDSSLFGALTGSLKFVTQSPRLNQLVWAVQYFAYDGSNNLVGSFWSKGATSYASACTTPTQYQ